MVIWGLSTHHFSSVCKMKGVGAHHSLMGFRSFMANAFLIKPMKNYLCAISEERHILHGVGLSIINTIFQIFTTCP